ncbi:MAG: AmmeMemoRadiSam system radical SAM enzyme [Candidatus Omnitrophica bacterium]|nr:AmmeMemoRadiSam system radical SAM enzyme [Candidatus Omnitrophota bacterium]
MFSLGADSEKSSDLKKALYWKEYDQGRLQCNLCPRRCILASGEKGFCRARKNISGVLYTLTYGQPVALHVDPIEKKPLAHVYPGTKSFSIATAGCNLRCKFCQNWEISQLDAEKIDVKPLSAQEIVNQALDSGSKTIAFTYTEPTIFFEYMLDIAKEAKTKGIDCVMHSAGYINEEPLREISKYITAANIDLKGFKDKFYSDFCEGDVQTVLRTLKILKEEGVWIEITNLLIPGANDSQEDLKELCAWVKENLGADTPIHFSRFYPQYKLTNLSPTPLKSLKRAEKIAKETGLHFIYIGNVPLQVGEDTYCPYCHKLLVKRIGYRVLLNRISNGRCSHCNKKIAGIWE